ncbi:hypothetical protein VNI00_007750 [Paramarasmius palmivorus]|uniref:Carrier domain-containing protein n=1 Tax=Paramarasmius palmivorus TaxID=297713 RepID=A0AAW0D2I0_9AGAR
MPASSLSDSFRTISDIRHDRIIPLGINQTSRELGQTDPYNLLAHERFDIHAKSTPSAIALDYEGSSFMTYSELAAHSDALAAELSAKGVTSDVMVPILFDVSFDMVVAILAIMKAGGAYVPLVPDHPQARWERILDLTTARLLVCDTGIARQTVIGDIRKSFPELTVLPYSHDTFTSSSTASNFIPNAKENNLAYVFFTSGSTGVPKGVAVEHRNLRAFLNTGKGNAMTMPGMRKLLFASYGFDISVGDIFSALTTGGTLGLVKRESLFSDIPHWLDVMKPTHIGVTPSIARYIPTEGLPHLRYVLLNGETLPVYLALRLSRTREVHNIMGPTEATIDATELIIPTSDESSFRERVPIGYPIGENTIYILRPGTLELAAQGEVGEICIGGPQVARGYIGDPELSNSKFVPDPFHEDPGMMFRSADLGRWNHLGQLDHLGRMDGQVKLRGLRIETGEIEYVVQKSNPDLHVVHADVVQHRDEQVMVAVFILKGMTGAEWVVPSSNEAVSRAIKFASSACDMYLPRYMKPAVWLSVTDFPTTTSRKIDRSTLRAKIQNHLSTISTTPRESIRHATTSIETLVVSIASEVLAIPSENIDLNASLVALGSSSIQAMGLTAKLREGGLDATILGLLDERVTLADLAALPTSNTAQVNGAQEHVIYAPFALAPSGWQNAAQRLNINIEDVEDVYPVDVIAQDWVQLALNHGGRGLLTQYKYDLSGDLDADRFAWSWEQLVLREPSLRTVFINVDLDFEQAKKVENGITYAESAGLNAAVLRSNVRGRGPFFDMVIAQDAGEANALISKMFGEHGLELGVVPIRNLLVYNERDFTWLFASSRHHALHDFRSLTMQSEELSDLYHKGEAAFPAIEGRRSIEKSFGAFMQVAHAYERRAAGRVFWREYLADVGLPVWPPISQVPLTFYKDFNTYGIHVSMWNGNMASIAKKLHVTKGALARTAYAIALSEKERREKVAMYEIVDGLGGTGMNPWGFGTHYQYTKVNTSPASDDMSELDRFIKVARDCHQGFVETLPHRASGCDMAAEIVGASSERGQHFASALLNIFDLTTSQTPVEPTKEVQTFSLLQRFATTEQGSFVGVNFPLNVGIRILDHVTILACPYDLSMISKEEMDTFVQRHVGVLDKLSEVLG